MRRGLIALTVIGIVWAAFSGLVVGWLFWASIAPGNGSGDSNPFRALRETGPLILAGPVFAVLAVLLAWRMAGAGRWEWSLVCAAAPLAVAALAFSVQ